MILHIARLHHPVTALGPGTRLGIWTQGCALACPGCLSRDTWEAGPEHAVDTRVVLEWCDRPDPAGIDGVSISGGEPSEQPEALAELLVGLAERRERHGWDLLCWTGLEEEDFADRCPEAYARLDGLVTGPYRVAEAGGGRWRGSANQRLVPLTDLGRQRLGRWAGDGPGSGHPAELQFQVEDDRLHLIGVPRPGDPARIQKALAAQGISLDGVTWRP
ncbi:4Fe-4S single cluster domain-containing protein [Streptomyces sp. NPDC002685]|uniref:4Fe-4S single cluster domain-containing protein n=1 Tax=Streptomyces sp. NPDC002685 TaxID=3154540 RepID=UPI0033194494